LLRLGRRIAANREGKGSYWYIVRGENKVAIKNAYWKTVALYGNEWRVVGVHVDKDKSASRSTPILSSAKQEERLGAFAKEENLIKALSKEDKQETMKLFEVFYNATPGIYAIQWVDDKGVNRFGYPAGNSLVNYDFHQKRDAGDQDVLSVLKSQKKAARDAPLIEGGVGLFNFEPVFDGDRYCGMIYIVRLKR